MLMMVAPAEVIRVRREVRMRSCSGSALAQKLFQGRPKVAPLRADLVVRDLA